MKLSDEYTGPAVLYQYLPAPTAVKKTTDILSARRIKLSKIGATNDPFDTLPVLKEVKDPKRIRRYLEENAGRLGIEGKVTPKLIADWKAQWDQVCKNSLQKWPGYARETLLLCLSRRDNGVLLWSHYAQNHRGFAIGFRSKVLIDAQPATLPFEVEYENERPEFDLTSAFDSQGIASSLHQVMKQKSREWKYEEEWRAIHQRDTLLEHEYLPFSVEAVECVILGALVERELVVQLREACVKGGLEAVSLKRARISEQRYELRIHPTTWTEALKR